MTIAFGEWLRSAREALGLTREQLRRRILRQFDTAPTVDAIRRLETGRRKKPQLQNRIKFERVLNVRR